MVLAVSPGRSPGSPAAFGTFSIVARDAQTGDLGVAVQSKFLAVGAVVPWARAGAGAIATQALANTSFGPRGLELLERGAAAAEVVERLVADDPESEHRQVGVVDALGGSSAHTGSRCYAWAGHRCGPGYACQGNILVGRDTVEAMAEAFLGARGELAERLIAALSAGQAAGGDRRGQQSAALLVVRVGGGYGGFTDRLVDLRVDDHPRPIEELARLYRLHRLYFTRPDPGAALALEGELAAEVRGLLVRLGCLEPGEAGGAWDAAAAEALTRFHHTENLEERLCPPGRLDPGVLEFMRGLVAGAEAQR
ncbi:MAG: DUF1028 domain-containing protein [Acetobacteraceae bacterium]|nr:DUF1028 domain-containing protein [Acetobacteraceae bacterium]